MKAKPSPKRRRQVDPQVVYRQGRPTAVLLDIKEYRRLLERLEDQYDLKRLAELEQRGGSYRPLEEYLAEQAKR